MAGFAVVLMLEPGATAPAPPNWFKDYFLSTTSGVGAYWWKQSNGASRLDGDVYGWYTFPPGTNYNNRQAIFNQMLQVANPQVVAAKGKTIQEEYSKCIIFVGLRAGGVGATQAGSTSVKLSLDRPFGGYMVVDTNSSFNFIAHEVGHQLNIPHSFDDTNTQYQPWKTDGGEYGHPYCIMSAQTYGTSNPKPVWTPDPTAPNAMQRIGPSLNGWVASLVSPPWAKYVLWRVGVDADLTIELESLGSWAAGRPKVVRVQTPGTNLFAIDEFFIEYRNNQDYYDRGLPASLVVINQGQGGRGYRAKNSAAATFVSEIRLPLALGRSASVYNNAKHGFAIEVLDWTQSTVKLRIFKGIAKPVSVWATATTQTGNVERMPMGTFDYTNAGVHCVTGVWEITRNLIPRIVTIEWPLPPWPQTFQTQWWVNGQELIGPAGMIQVATEADSPFPLPNGTSGPRTVELGFASNGSNQLKLSNRPQDGNFSVDVQCRAAFSATTLDQTLEVDFEGEAIGHGTQEGDFENAFVACLIGERDRFRPHRAPRKFVIPVPIAPRPPEEPRHLSRNDLLDVLEQIPENPLKASVYRQLFREITGIAPQRVQMMEASLVSTELPKEVTPCSSESEQDLKTSETGGTTSVSSS